MIFLINLLLGVISKCCSTPSDVTFTCKPIFLYDSVMVQACYLRFDTLSSLKESLTCHNNLLGLKRHLGI